jgi:acyl-homoserine lactone acylase PvdQ
MADVYEEEMRRDPRLQYRYDGKWLDVRVEHEVFRVKTAEGMKTLTLPLYYTHHGPIVKSDPQRQRAWAVKLPNFDGVNYALGLYGLMKAENLDQFQAALARQLLPRWNLLYSDAQNIYWVHNGNVAQRDERYDWTRPVPGWTKETEWGPYFPFDRYPQVLNPAAGFLQNCNNPPWVCTRNSGLDPLDPAPYYLKNRPPTRAGEEVLNTRGERLFQVLSQDKKFTLQDMIDLGWDTYIMPAEAIVPLLLRAQKAHPDRASNPRIARALECLRAWDLRSSKESAAFTYLYYWGKAHQELFPGKFSRFVAYSRRQLDLDSAEEQKMALDALERAIDRLDKRFGKSEVPWGEINVVVRGGVFPLGGADTMYDPLHVDEGPQQPDGRIHCNDGWGHLMVVMEGEPKQIWSLLPYGQSEDRASPHYNDQAKLHSRRQVKRFWFTPTEILEHTESVWGDADRIRRLIAAPGQSPSGQGCPAPNGTKLDASTTTRRKRRASYRWRAKRA